MCVCTPTKGHVRLRRMSCLSYRLVAQAVAIVLREVTVWSVLFVVFLVPVDSDVVLTASVVLRAKGSL